VPELTDLLKRLAAEGKITFQVKVVPRASKSELVGFLEDGSLKVRLAAVPEKGKANEELKELLSRAFGVTRKQVEIIAGDASQRKLVRVTHGA
jgi:uncharacterized protein